ncbi:helix-turn-helix transcriptional regulator [Kribbella sandramycini]|uniref:DNA-binding CsgD family transcriptional regulator n=2 Tax=Kribbella sandramycini TaxID=60450 RepID=A0A841SK44_9ACTN|nr:LuxR C-terminal-related transcriptional regulator [Kribbella sandramycini]MBB6571639.1 DNA-binding CsgD family transcriptional regulator [Kribbella sandramycini]
MDVLAAAAQILDGSPEELLPRLSTALAELVPHRAVAQLASQCATTPVYTYGDPTLARAITGAELAGLLGTVTAGRPWHGVVPVGGVDHPALAIASDRAPRGSVLLFIKVDGVEYGEHDAVLQAVWDLATIHMYRLTQESDPSATAQSRAVADARFDVAAELGEAHAATLATLLGVLRNQRIDDAAARSTAVEVALNSLAELRIDTRRERTYHGEESAGRAFDRLAESLRALLRHTTVELELDAPGNDQMLPGDLAHTARVAVRSIVLAMLTQDDVRRIRVGWQWDGADLHTVIRDDGPGRLDGVLVLGQLSERLRLRAGQLDLEAVPGWGLTARITLTLGATPLPAEDPLAPLGARELEVLERIAQGSRNRSIADDLHISESTVKFHVANILTKLAVTTRTQAAALYHATSA